MNNLEKKQRAKRALLGLGECKISNGRLWSIEPGRNNIIHFPKGCLHAQRNSIKLGDCEGIVINKEFIGGIENIFDKPDYSLDICFLRFCGTGYRGVVDFIRRMELQEVYFTFGTFFELSEENFIPQMVGVLYTSILSKPYVAGGSPIPRKPWVEINKQDAWEWLRKNPKEKQRVESGLCKRLSKINAKIPMWFYE